MSANIKNAKNLMDVENVFFKNSKINSKTDKNKKEVIYSI